MMKFFLKKVKILNKRANLFWHWQTGCHSLKITSKFFCQPREVSRKFMTYIIFNTKLKKNLSHHQGRTSTFPPSPHTVSRFSHSQEGGEGRWDKKSCPTSVHADWWMKSLPTPSYHSLAIPISCQLFPSFNIFLYLTAPSSASDRWWIQFSVPLIYPPLLQSKLLLSFLC